MTLAELKKALVSRFARWRFNRVVRNVHSLPPMEHGQEQFTILSMVHSRDVDAWLLAIRSFARFINPHRIVVVCDPSITEADRALLRHGVPHVVLRDAVEFRHPDLPVGGCWERLYAITEYAADEYVVQLDADTVALDAMTEVRAAIISQIAFTHGERPDQQITSLEESAARMERSAKRVKPHVQAVAEYALRLLPADMPQRYTRGCAGFSGFPPDAHLRERLLTFAGHMGTLLAERWSEWGTEQFASNYLIANYPHAEVLPVPRYCAAVQCDSTTGFIHFIGYCRFTNLRYSRLAHSIIAVLAQR